jgi:hypothetical protein
MSVSSRISCLRFLLALMFASATVIGLSVPMTAKAVGHAVAAHQAGAEQHSHQQHSHHQHEALDCGINSEIQLNCLGCVVHCLGMATLDEIDGLSHPLAWRDHVTADQYGNGVAPPCLERPPNIAG